MATTSRLRVGSTRTASRCRPGPRQSRAPRGQRTQHRLNRGERTASSTTRCTSSRSPAPNATQPPRNTSREEAEGKTKKGAQKGMPGLTKGQLATSRAPLFGAAAYNLLAGPPADQHDEKPITIAADRATRDPPASPARAGRSSRSMQPPARWSASARNRLGTEHTTDDQPAALAARYRPTVTIADDFASRESARSSNTRTGGRQPTRSKPFCCPRRTVRARQNPRFRRLSAPRPRRVKQPGAETPK